MDKELINRLQKYNTPENFYKLCMWVVEAAGEGLSINECDAGELLFLDVVSAVEMVPPDRSEFPAPGMAHG